jgi:hypothetical protein
VALNLWLLVFYFLMVGTLCAFGVECKSIN